MLATKKKSDGSPYCVYPCAGGTRSKLLFASCARVANRIEFAPKSNVADERGRIVRSLDALRPLALCGCDCKIPTALCFGHQQYSVSCIHPPQRCVSTRQMTDNVFQINTAALAQSSCKSSDCGVFFTDFACAYPSVNHSSILRVLHKAGLTKYAAI